jgi:mono/diheme cytochrome c family protein
MTMRAKGPLVFAALTLGALSVLPPAVRAQHAGHGAAAPAPGAARTYTMEELHKGGGVPPGWKFTLPAGDAVKGRALFRELECYKCHAVKGEGFPPSGDAKNVGPELTGMGGHHPAEYFAESIIAPDAVILAGPGFRGPDGRSIMPSFADSLAVSQLTDLVAYLKSLTEAAGDHHDHGAAPAERTAGDYTVRLEYKGGDKAHGDHAGHGPMAAAGHLMVFVTDRASGEPVPYLPVIATIRAAGKPARTVKLAPMVGAGGFHYGANVVLPDGAEKITLTIGRPAMQVMESAKGRYATPVTVVFDGRP